MARREKWCIVEDYEFYEGSSDMQVFAYESEAMALLALKLHYERVVKSLKDCGFEIEESYIGDNRAWMTMKDGSSAEMRVCRIKPINY